MRELFFRDVWFSEGVDLFYISFELDIRLGFFAFDETGALRLLASRFSSLSDEGASCLKRDIFGVLLSLLTFRGMPLLCFWIFAHQFRLFAGGCRRERYGFGYALPVFKFSRCDDRKFSLWRFCFTYFRGILA